MAPYNDLEQEAISRTQKLADELCEFHELGELWAKFGIVGDIVVSTILVLLVLSPCLFYSSD